MAKITLIAAIGKNNELGKDNKLLWHLKEDLKFFKEQTINKKIILGRKTLESLPGLLPKRVHLVLTSQNLEENDRVKVFHTINELIKYLNTIDEEVMVIGGGKIYKEFLPYATTLILTEIEEETEADTFFPEFNKKLFTKETISTHEENGIKYSHIIYKRLKEIK